MTIAIVAAAAFAATLERKPLSDVLARAGKVVEKRNSIPILSNVLLRASGDAVTVTATDLDMTLTESVDATECQPGAVTVNCDALAKALKGMKGERVRLAYAGERLSVTDCETGANVRLATLPAADWPNTMESRAECAFAIDAAQLVADWSRIRSAVSSEETRYYLNGILMHAPETNGGRVLRMAATDGHRLGRITRPLPAGAEALPDIIVPRKTVANVLAWLGKKAAGDVAFEVRKANVGERIRIQANGWHLDAKTIDGSFPDYSRVIPSANDKRLRVDSAALVSAIDGATSVCSDKVRSVCLSLHPDYIVASATDPANGQAANIVEGASHDGGEAWSIGFNAAYLKDVLATLPGEALAQLADNSAPTLFECADAPELTWVVMPMRVNGGHVWSRRDVERLNMDPAQLFQADAPGLLASRSFKLFAPLLAAYRAHLLACGGEPQRVHLVLAAVCAALRGDTEREARARAILAAMDGEQPAPVTVEPLTAPEMTTEAEIDEAAAAEAEGLVILGEVEDADVAAEPAPFEPVPDDQREDDGDVTVYCSPPIAPAPDGPVSLAETVERLATMVADLQRQVAAVAGGDPARVAELEAENAALREDLAAETVRADANARLAESNASAAAAEREDAETVRAALRDMTAIAERNGERAEAAEASYDIMRDEAAKARQDAERIRLATGFGSIGGFVPWRGNHPANARVRLVVSN